MFLNFHSNISDLPINFPATRFLIQCSLKKIRNKREANPGIKVRSNVHEKRTEARVRLCAGRFSALVTFFAGGLVTCYLGVQRLGGAPYSGSGAMSQSRNPPSKALALWPSRVFGGSSFSFLTLPPPNTTSVGWRAPINR